MWQTQILLGFGYQKHKSLSWITMTIPRISSSLLNNWSVPLLWPYTWIIEWIRLKKGDGPQFDRAFFLCMATDFSWFLNWFSYGTLGSPTRTWSVISCVSVSSSQVYTALIRDRWPHSVLEWAQFEKHVIIVAVFSAKRDVSRELLTDITVFCVVFQSLKTIFYELVVLLSKSRFSKWGIGPHTHIYKPFYSYHYYNIFTQEMPTS